MVPCMISLYITITYNYRHHSWPFCHVAIQCPHLAHPANGNLTLSGDTFRETANYSCNTGCNLFGDSRLMCGINGQWGGILLYAKVGFLSIIFVHINSSHAYS